MNVNPIGLVEVLIILTGFGLVYLTSAWSPLGRAHRFWVGFVALLLAYLTILPGLAYAKSAQTFLVGKEKPGVFYAWVFGLWFSLSLLRHSNRGSKAFGVFSLGVFGLLLVKVISEELKSVLGD